MSTALCHVTLYDFESFYEDAYIIFDETIIDIGPMSAFKSADHHVIDGHGQWVLPGLVCGHTHIYSTFARGLSLPFDPQDFQDILDQLWWKIDHHLDLESIYHSGVVSGIDFLKNGVTTLIDHHASGTVKGALAALQKALVDTIGMRAVLAFETSDRFDVQDAIEENLEALRNRIPSQLGALFGLHASMSLSETTLKAVKSVLGETPIHIHVAESHLDQENALNVYGERVVERLERHGLLNPDSLITHAIHVSEKELDMLKARGCVIAVNVSSNMNNSVGLPNIPHFMNKGIPVILGNDGLSNGMAHEYLAVLYAMHHKKNTPNAFHLGHLKTMIRDTYTYASKQLNTQLGRLQKGAVADLLMVPYVPPTPLDADNALGHLFYGMFNAFKPKHVFVSGRMLVKDYQVCSELMESYTSSQKVASQLWDRIKKEAT